MGKTKVLYQGAQVDAETVAVESFDEHANRYTLEDGTELMMRTVIAEVARISGEYDDVGNPIYSVRSQNLVVVHSATDEVRRPPDPDEDDVL